MPRWLQVVIVALAVTFTSGAPTVLASVTFADDCADDCGADDRGEAPACPPFCHDCLCRVHFGAPAPVGGVAARADEPQLISVPLAPPSLQAPPPPGVFHPPRVSA
jgi:hypothetical protein